MAVSKTAASLVTCVCVVCLSAMFGVIRFSVCVYCGTLEQLCSNSIRIWLNGQIIIISADADAFLAFIQSPNPIETMCVCLSFFSNSGWGFCGGGDGGQWGWGEVVHHADYYSKGGDFLSTVRETGCKFTCSECLCGFLDKIACARHGHRPLMRWLAHK